MCATLDVPLATLPAAPAHPASDGSAPSQPQVQPAEIKMSSLTSKVDTHSPFPCPSPATTGMVYHDPERLVVAVGIDNPETRRVVGACQRATQLPVADPWWCRLGRMVRRWIPAFVLAWIGGGDS